MNDPGQLSTTARHALSHIRARTGQERFATGADPLSAREWDDALQEIRDAGYLIAWVCGTVADDPQVLGGWTLQSGPLASRQAEADQAARLAKLARPRQAERSAGSETPPAASSPPAARPAGQVRRGSAR